MSPGPGPSPEMKLALGPIQYFWSRESVYAFYEEAAAWPVDIVYLGETVCPKRRALGPDAWLELADGLSGAGKKVVLSTLALLEAGSELGALKRLCNNGRYPVEANDMAAVRLLAGRAPFVAGTHLNVYNQESLALMAESGAFRWLPPAEISAATLADLQSACPPSLETEVLAFGRLPLAFSARCFTARAHDVPKDECGFCCDQYDDGMPLETLDGNALFTVNGVQLQSAAPCNLLDRVDELAGAGVDVLRISPMAAGTGRVVEAFRAVFGGSLEGSEAVRALAPLSPVGWCNGYWSGHPGMDWRAA